MTENEAEKQQQLKAEATARLTSEQIGRYRLRELDPRIDEYVRDVASNPSKHNVWEQLAVCQFFDKCTKYGIQTSEVVKFFTLYESLSFPGRGGLTSYRLTPVQAFQFANIFAFWRNGRRVVREVCLFVPRKFSKTTGTASLAVYDLLFGEANAEAYVGANSADQAKKCFDVIRMCMQRLDPDGRRYTVNEERIKSRRKDRTAIAQCLTATARTKDGLNASTIIMDEFSQARDNLLLTVLTTSMGVRDNPLTVIITTASDVFDGPFYSMLQGYKKVLMGEIDDDSVFAHIFEPDIGDAEDDPATWRKVHPHIGITVNEDFYASEYRKAVRDGAEAMLAFRTKLLNIFAVNDMKSWISSERARAAMTDIDPKKNWKGSTAMVAFDLSESDDFSAITLGLYDPRRKVYGFRTEYFFPEGALDGHPNARLYRVWAEQGYLHLLPGEVIDYRYIVERILSYNKEARILKIGYDPWKHDEVTNMLRAGILAQKGNPDNILRGIRQTHGYFTSPCDAFEHGLKTGKVFIDLNPINAYCFGNAVMDYDNLENKKPMKRSQYQKIDGVITMLMSMRLFIDQTRPLGQSSQE